MWRIAASGQNGSDAIVSPCQPPLFGLQVPRCDVREIRDEQAATHVSDAARSVDPFEIDPDLENAQPELQSKHGMGCLVVGYHLTVADRVVEQVGLQEFKA
ncbi:hypothetical protein [Beijerinckia sp. L45]|uniref:hypothetical protein n=1 Tax=Beijerinckia sp. L45 TaxID=1641855 RepID=UPI00131B12CC|nr:hypothetical protein [Beijerinckia sp. L45]